MLGLRFNTATCIGSRQCLEPLRLCSVFGRALNVQAMPGLSILLPANVAASHVDMAVKERIIVNTPGPTGRGYWHTQAMHLA